MKAGLPWSLAIACLVLSACDHRPFQLATIVLKKTTPASNELAAAASADAVQTLVTRTQAEALAALRVIKEDQDPDGLRLVDPDCAKTPQACAAIDELTANERASLRLTLPASAKLLPQIAALETYTFEVTPLGDTQWPATGDELAEIDSTAKIVRLNRAKLQEFKADDVLTAILDLSGRLTGLWATPRLCSGETALQSIFVFNRTKKMTFPRGGQDWWLIRDMFTRPDESTIPGDFISNDPQCELTVADGSLLSPEARTCRYPLGTTRPRNLMVRGRLTPSGPYAVTFRLRLQPNGDHYELRLAGDTNGSTVRWVRVVSSVATELSQRTTLGNWVNFDSTLYNQQLWMPGTASSPNGYSFVVDEAPIDRAGRVEVEMRNATFDWLEVR